MNSSSRVADVLSFVAMAGLTLASALTLGAYAPANAHQAQAPVLTVLPTVVITGSRSVATVHRLPTVVVTAKRADAATQLAACDKTPTAVC
ncbi:uncharacterized protein YggE [Inhella inkyongensis]|uniref:Uncharacterized protein YggE n=1 Tax=Inhella inkyongensis TaxID=392593 RepID=A0A840S3B8_9BURK|nr:hypothetical protein [Inhella inkyongensis]MBB5204825.1 uncharacterized protein YggE [Inhella inkyongensis]